jgi:type IV secretion system protein TrbL
LSGASAAYRSGGLAGVAEAGSSAAMSPLRRATTASASNGQASEPAASASADGQPDWARRMKRAETIRHGASTAGHAVRSGDHGGSGSSVDLSEGEH